MPNRKPKSRNKRMRMRKKMSLSLRANLKRKTLATRETRNELRIEQK